MDRLDLLVLLVLLIQSILLVPEVLQDLLSLHHIHLFLEVVPGVGIILYCGYIGLHVLMLMLCQRIKKTNSVVVSSVVRIKILVFVLLNNITRDTYTQ